MTSHAHYSKATLGGHPIHAMIVGLPIAFYTTGILALIVYAGRRDPFWYHVSMVLLFAGVITALVAAVFGMIDLFVGVPRESSARRTGVKHFGLQVFAAVLFAGAAFMMRGDWIGAPPAPHQLRIAPPLVISLIGFIAMSVAARLGWKMVQIQHVGVDLSQPEPVASDRVRP
jgi:uncharacterized membrane protein